MSVVCLYYGNKHVKLDSCHPINTLLLLLLFAAAAAAVAAAAAASVCCLCVSQCSLTITIFMCATAMFSFSFEFIFAFILSSGSFCSVLLFFFAGLQCIWLFRLLLRVFFCCCCCCCLLSACSFVNKFVSVRMLWIQPVSPFVWRSIQFIFTLDTYELGRSYLSIDLYGLKLLIAFTFRIKYKHIDSTT